MALEESIDELEKIESNGIEAYIDPKLNKALEPHGDINVDFINNGPMGSGFTIRVGEPKSCGDGGCSC